MKISFGAIRRDGVVGELVGPNSFKLDMAKVDARFSAPEMNGYDETAAIGGTAVHEATHGRDQATGIFDFRAPQSRDELWPVWGEEEEEEERAYRNESLVFQGLEKASPDNLWNPSWKAADKEALRSYNVFTSAVVSANVAVFGQR